MISIIIPVLNEEKVIGELLQHLKQNSTESNISDIIVVDGGSTDDTLQIITDFAASSDSEHSEELYREAVKKFLIQNSLSKIPLELTHNLFHQNEVAQNK